MFHYLFPIGTMGLAPFVAAYTWKAARRRDEESARIATFWTKIFAINLAAGVVTGIPMEFQFGTNWAAFSRIAGSVVGQPLAMEGMFAFFLESVFLGALLYRGRGLPSTFAAWAGVMVCVGAWLSGFFIVATNAWMQHPVGYRIAADGTILLENIWRVLFSPFSYWQFAHVLCGALLAGGFIVAGVGAYYLLSRWDARCLRLRVDRGLSDRRSQRANRDAVSAGQACRRRRPLHDGARGAACNHRDARRRAQALDRSDICPRFLEFSQLRKLQGQRQWARRVCARAVAARRTDLLCVPHHGRSWDDLRRGRNGRGYVASVWKALERSLDALDSDAARAVSVHCQRSRLGGHRGRAPAVDRLRFDEDRGGKLADGSERGDDLHADRLCGHVLLAGLSLLASHAAGDRTGSIAGEARVSVAAFVTIAFMFAMYVMLDGYDLGVATIGALIARCERDRSAVMASIGPFWNGNEVWLIAAAAALFALFPAAYAAAFSGFYLPFIVALWLLMLRAIAPELREHF